MEKIEAFQEHVAMKFRLYNGLLLHMPFPEVQESGMLLPLFSTECREGLAAGRSPREIVRSFLHFDGTASDSQPTDTATLDSLFSMLRIIERQVVLFDSLEDAGFARIHEMKGAGSLQDLLNRIERKNKTTEYRDFIDKYKVRVVLTAHPTQFYTDEVLSILTDLAGSVERNELRNVHDYLLQLAQTRFKNPQKPTPLEEAHSLMWILEHVMYAVIPDIHARMVSALDIDTESTLQYPGKIQLGFWPGGDRDGNPYVTADLTEQVAGMLRAAILRMYLQDFRELRRRLTFSSVMSTMERIQFRLEAALEGCNTALLPGDYEPYETPHELLEDLTEVYRRVQEENSGLFADRIASLVYKVQCFGFHFASLDVRQDSSVHERVWQRLVPLLCSQDILPQGTEYSALSVPERIQLLSDCCMALSKVDAGECARWNRAWADKIEQEGDSVGADVLRSFNAIRVIQNKNSEQGAHRYIISNAQSEAHVLEVLALAMLSGISHESLTLDVVPLFETIEDLHNADGVMRRLYAHPVYREHLKKRGNDQTIMLGFSDGTKDGGYLTANWEIYRAKERLTELARSQGIRVAFFDGRGGPPARGGGNTHKFYRSLGREIDSSSIQLTIQGQTISSMYGMPDAATYNLEQIISAGIENNLFVTDHMQLSNEDRALLDDLSVRARAAYRELRDDPLFVRYLETMTPLSYYGRTNIGSRPVKRGGKSELTLGDLRAIPFVGGWSQSKLNVPGYYGFGSALKEFAEEGRLEELKKLCSGNLFFRTIIENSMQSLTKANFRLTGSHGDDENFGGFWHRLKKEAEETRELLIAITGQGDLLDTNPVIRASIAMREDMILPSLVIQQFALSEIREMSGSAEIRQKLEKLVVKALAIGVNASRNSV
ncbi:MAG: phosphoenolpyruvate carboxylase [Spirochaeta sp.]